ncbi:hypothetical protein [Actinokineospora sp. HUAS TT18]|uniref:hypothetical protein n=1 Tax=Actinokineospora sp. HUAS TT18 TaxID=3447451 RepID=UPI003F52473E
MSTEHTHPEHASTSAVAGLAREVEALRRTVDPLPGRTREVGDHVTRIAGQVQELAETVARKNTRAEKVAAPSWLTLPSDVDTVAAVLNDLCKWMSTVYLRYADAAASLPACWLWHPDVVEELVWLMHAWIAAYDDDGASALAAGDWHDRYRPGVVRRIKTTAGTCSLESHTDPHAGPRVPLVEAAEAIVDWWGSTRTAHAPAPSEAHLLAAEPTPVWAGGRR